MSMYLFPNTNVLLAHHQGDVSCLSHLFARIQFAKAKRMAIPFTIADGVPTSANAMDAEFQDSIA